ncbi:dephospho-CoA kinase [Aliivibrio kagoshimensis]|uniref:dephospho-CoA kinase n=1 Tax=Aliivibrio kagoshimensis TaxID=2910230 RepID=UPI003D0C7976
MNHKSHTFVVGVTGGIGSGKTTVTNLFHELYGIEIVDADIIAREVVAPNSEGLSKIVTHFGSDILLSNGRLNREKLRAIIFSQPDEKSWLNELLHPMIRQQMLTQAQATTSPYCLLVIPLLIDNGLQYLVDRILVIDVDQQTQISRTANRDSVTIEQAKSILSAQISREERLAFADDVINNNGDNSELKPIIGLLHEQYLALASTFSENG